MKTHKSPLLFLLFLLIALPTKAEYFRNLSLKDGLSQVSVMSICQDGLGRMWFGTQEGINVYDGQQITSYKGWIKNDTDSLQWLGNDMECLQQGKDGNIYFLADQNIFCYDIRLEKFIQLTTGHLTSCLTISGQAIWYIKGDSIFQMGIPQGSSTYIRKSPTTDIMHIKLTSDGMCLIGSKHGLFFFHPQQPNEETKQLLKGIEIYSIFESSQKEIWISSVMQGLYRLKNGKLSQVPYSPNDGKGISDHQIREFCEDSQHNIWFGTFSGLQKYTTSTKLFSKIQIPPYAGGLTHPSVFSLYKDNQETIWVGTYFGGVNFFSPKNESLVHYNYQLQSDKNTYYSYIGEMTKDKHGHLWISTDGGGISKLDKDWNLLEQYTSNQIHSLPHNNIKSLAYDPETDCLYIGTYLGGLSKYDIARRSFYNYPIASADGTSHPGNIIYHVQIWNHELYLNSRNGTFRMNPKTNQMTFVTYHGAYCEHFDIAPNGDMYFMGTNYIEIYSLVKGKLINRLELADFGSKGNISQLLATNEGVYICTLGSGLFYYETDTKTVKQYQTDNGLPSNYCYNIKQVDNDQLVITSDNGITLFTPSEHKFSTINGRSEMEIINRCGLYVSPEKDIYVGDTKGVTLFSLGTFSRNNQDDLNLYFSHLHINNQLIYPQGKDGILQEALPYTHAIDLKHYQNNCIIDFSLSNYKEQDHHQLFEYKLEGFNKQWIQTSGHRIYYTNLDPGNYTLFVRPQKCPNQTIQLKIRVSSPFYNTWWAWTVYILFTSSCILYWIYNRMAKRLLSLSLEKERIEKQHIEEMNRSKLVFFTNVSHEFRTPLTLIISHTDSLLQMQLPAQIYNKVMKIKQNTQYMTNLVSELLDFRKFTQNQVTLQICEQDICIFLKEIYLSFSDYAKQRNIDYQFHAEPETILCSFDSRQLEKVFFNLLSNAFKYTPSGKSIHMHIFCQDQKVIIEVADTGVGMEEKDTIHVFNRFFQAHNQEGVPTNQTGTGIGLALSKSIVETHHGQIGVESQYQKGSTFTVTLPLDSNCYKGDSHIQFVSQPAADNWAIDSLPAAPQAELPISGDNLLLQEAKEEKEAPASTQLKYSLLIVEDNEELQEVLKQLFHPFYKIYTAANGKEGLDLTFKHKPDIIVSDIMMPEMSGTEMCLQIKSNIDLCHIPVILLTALNSTEQNIEGLNRGADDYITKPFNAQVLLARTNNLLRNRLLIQHQLEKKPLSEVDLTSINPIDQKILQKASEIIDQYIDDVNFNIPKLAQEIGMGRSLLYAKFKALTGMTPNNFLLNYRLRYAATLMQQQPSATVAEISDRSGFSSPEYFSRCFKTQYGETPQNYKKSHG